ncbi:histidine kinase [Flavobacteriaceae bacterium S356]|uniref:Histidine kinase n=1 Tax=Asprobacillus argus TaxID=3076534 RepID=A0ABU3LE22_9FLAO|nr:histidine kinase [Flavobacteriaceae bacterium S356]
MRYLFFTFFLYITVASSQSNTPRNYNLSNGLTSSNITDLIQDDIGYLWIATQNNGIVRFDGSEFLRFSIEEGLLSNKINALTYATDSLFIATDKGLVIKTNLHQFIAIPNLEITNVKSIRDKVLLTSAQGLYLYQKQAVTPIKLNDQIDLNPVNDIAYFNNGYYIAGQKALWYVNTLTFPKKTVRIHDGEYTSLRVIGDKMFATTTSEGVQVFETNKNQFRFQNVKHITSINVFDNEYWISTDNNGVYIFNSNFDFEKRISKYNGFKVNNIREVFVDNDDNCWLATFGNGLYTYSLLKTDIPKKTTKIYFENIEIDYQPIDSISLNTYSNTLYLSPSQNTISFSFKAVDINTRDKMEYQWTLNENKGPWTTKSTVDFPNLNSGEYTFKVLSRNKPLQTTNPIEFSFFIDTPIYKKKWFIYSVITTLTLILILVIVLVIRNIKRKNAKKVKQLTLENHLLTLEQKALQLQMNPHFIFNVLNSIKALGNQEKMQEMNVAINNFALLLRGILQNSRQEEISLLQEIDTLKKYIALEQQISATSFQFAVNTDKVTIDLDEILIPPMLIQPFIENAIKHGIENTNTNGKITLSFEIKGTSLVCIITDNGIGYKQSKKKTRDTNHESIALKVTEERIKGMSGAQSFYISEIVQNGAVLGTKIWFKIPLKTEF